MSDKPETPFDGLDGAHEYVGLLCNALDDARVTIHEDIARATREGAQRRLEALQLVIYKLDRLEHHMTTGRRLLNDLRTLRRLLLGERRRTPRKRAPLLRSTPLDYPPRAPGRVT